MAITPNTPGIHHIALRCRDIAVTKEFYQNIIGLQLALDTPDLIGFVAGSVFVVFKKAEPVHPEDKTFTPFNIGLDHIALACENEDELKRFAQGLADAGVENTGVKLDETLQKLYVAFKDPDRIQWEFYMV
ncbi:VOC family protein [Adhaeribacter rhizoryzae]|uniref:VOC family protein n=1 Tax=Adhaeribacter rhizoryzae TaxID=2607907 RepID=A0A5M6D107_9BACT|nr:VOC family protein [Adhaeribacter rhizoryzae]KAA5541177.1 VOC family protein [Adhaeribacter rhizoryzae]